MSDQLGQSLINGFILSGKFIPETVLETLLSFAPVSDIPNLRRVRQLWKDIASRRSFWKEVFERNGLNWKANPNHVAMREDAWIVLFSAAKHKIFTKNFVRNHSGEDFVIQLFQNLTLNPEDVNSASSYSVWEPQFTHWEKIHDGGDKITVESPLAGISSLPANPDYASGVESAFVTWYGWSTIRQKIDLKEAGLTSEVMKAMIPFQFVCTPMVVIRFDSAAMYCLCLSLLVDNGDAMLYNISNGVHQAGEDWIQTYCTFNVLEEHMKGVRHLLVVIGGKDHQFWPGHYGAKFSRISVTVKCLTSDEVEKVEPHQIYYSHNDVANLFSGYRGIYRLLQ
ncbi:unnamed protein product [Allacma fusca]|uniref:F-box protein n=1 Tax=Allacma fusca TaxID=39272 RepID=A0A8J2JLI7_9HEXA|nr:unnamed protein product [Allacma fusca]